MSKRPSLNSLNTLLKRLQKPASLSGWGVVKVTTLLPAKEIVWMPPGVLIPAVDHSPCPLKLLGPPPPKPLPTTSSLMWQISGNKAVKQVSSWKHFLVVLQS